MLYNIVNDNYLQDSRVLYTFAPNNIYICIYIYIYIYIYIISRGKAGNYGKTEIYIYMYISRGETGNYE